MDLIPPDFPLRVDGVNIYSPRLSEPILVAASNEIATRAVEMLNEMEQITGEVIRKGSVTLIGNPVPK